MKKRTVAVLCAVAAVLGVIIGGTMAYLQHSVAVVNTFTAGTIGIKLAETTGNRYVMAPGVALSKDPKVTVEEGSESCYLFVKVTENNFKTSGQDPIAWTPAEGWTKVVDVDETVYYRVFEKGDTVHEFPFLANNQVTVSEDLTKTDMAGYKDKEPQLTFTAYAIQKDWLTGEDGGPITDPAAIWALAKVAKPTTNT